MAVEKCSSCGDKIRTGGMFGPNLLLPPIAVELINEYESEKQTERCQTCGSALYADHKKSLDREIASLTLKLATALEQALPLATIHSPHGWDYEVASLVTAQSVLGTGILVEIASEWTDFLGRQSKSYGQKLQTGEALCRNVLRKHAFDEGANAVIGVDVHYTEVGAHKGMLLVCMSGTAVRVRNSQVLGTRAAAAFDELSSITERLNHLGRYKAAE